MPWATGTRKGTVSETSRSRHAHNCAFTGTGGGDKQVALGVAIPRAPVKLHGAAGHDPVP